MATEISTYIHEGMEIPFEDWRKSASNAHGRFVNSAARLAQISISAQAYFEKNNVAMSPFAAFTCCYSESVQLITRSLTSKSI